MVISCKNYLTNNHTIDIRLLNTKELLNRINNINNLYETCREIFIKMKQKIENHYIDQSDDHLSERHLLGKLDFLNQRLNKVEHFYSIYAINYVFVLPLSFVK
jgi:hypothetical protein